MGFPATEFADCLIIAKKFERGAVYATNEESVFAMMTPLLDGIRAQSGSFGEQLDATEAISSPLSAQQSLLSAQSIAPNATLLSSEANSNIALNIDKADETSPDFAQTLAGNFGLVSEEGGFDMSGIFDSKCIPCGLRLDNLDVFFTEIGTGLAGGLSQYIQFWEKLLRDQWQQLQDMLKLFTNTDPYLDLCAFIKFFTDFMCVPDIARMLSALMALMQKVSFEFGGVFDLILQFIGPLMSPFLGNLVNTLESYLFMVIRPIECIIDSIQALLAKFDYNILFSNIDSLDKHIDMGGPKQGANLPGNSENERQFRKDDPRGDYTLRLDEPRLSPDEPKTPWIDGHIPRRDIVEDRRFMEADFNLAGPLSTAIRAENASNQTAVDTADKELQAIRTAGRGVDGSDADAISKQRTKERDAEDKYRSAKEERDLSYVGRANAGIDSGVAGLKSSLIMLIGYLREAVAAVQSFFDFLFDEFKKLMAEYVGGSGDFIGELIRKLALTQLIGIINQIYKAILRGAVCPEDVNDIKVENWIPAQQGLTIWTDDEGQIHIDGDDQEIADAVDQLVLAVGSDKPTGRAAEIDKGDQPSTPGEKLKGLVEFTGDSVLDTEIARMTEQLTTPVSVIFKCPLQTGVAQAEQVNQWIREVNTQ